MFERLKSRGASDVVATVVPPPAPKPFVRVLGLTMPVLIWPTGTLQLDGEHMEAVADADERCIWIDGEVPRARRLELLLSTAYRHWR